MQTRNILASTRSNERIRRQKTCEQFTIKPNLAGGSKQMPQVRDAFFSFPEVALLWGDAAACGEEMSVMSLDEVEDVSWEAISCKNQQSLPL